MKYLISFIVFMSEGTAENIKQNSYLNEKVVEY